MEKINKQNEQIPIPERKDGLAAVRGLIDAKSPLGALSALHREMGDIFTIPLPGFNPVVLVGPEANRFVLVSGKEDLYWRNEADPVVDLLQNGVLVTDGEQHDMLRKRINPTVHWKMLGDYVSTMVNSTDEINESWELKGEYNMLDEMRKIALLILMRSLFAVDFKDDLEKMWQPILKSIKYISPGLWVLWPKTPRLGFSKKRRELDAYLFRLIQERRKKGGQRNDMLSLLIHEYKMSDSLIRDQLLTMLIAGHDTSTAALSWILYLLGKHEKWMKDVVNEIDKKIAGENPDMENIKSLKKLDMVVKEALRLYPPIHIGGRVAARDVSFGNYLIPEGRRVVYSIYLSHRHPGYWQDPDLFRPERFEKQAEKERPHYLYLPFGGGRRNCIGFSFASVEVKIVIARILQMYKLLLKNQKIHPHMGATLEPRPGVFMEVERR